MRSGDHPPLWTWIAALGLGLAGVLGSWFVGRQFGPVYESIYLNLDRLNARSPSSPMIVVIGSSRVWCAVEADSAMSRRFLLKGASAHVVRVTQGGATLRDFAVLLKRLPSVRPAAVVIESDLVTLEPNAFRIPGTPQYSDWRERSRHGFAALLAPSAVAKHGLENRDSEQSRCSFHTDAKSETMRFNALAERRPSTPAERVPVVELAQKLKALGVAVVLLDLPNRDDEIGRRPAALIRGEEQAMQHLMATGLFYRFANPPKLKPADFEDAGHVSSRGQAEVSEWLAERLKGLLGAGVRR